MVPLLALLFSAAPDAGAALPPYYFDRAVTAKDLDGKTLRELSLTRNVIFARAGQPFRKQWIREYFTQFDWYKPGKLDRTKLTKADLANSEFIAKYEIDLSEGELEQRIEALDNQYARAASAPKEAIVELFLLHEALGKAPPAWLFKLDPTKKKHPLSSPAVLDELLNVDQLSDLSKRDLRILRNTVFARRGRPFKTETMREYFEKKDWYQVDEKYTDKRLTKVDLTNIKLIRSVEESLGGPETEPTDEPPDAFMMVA